MLVVSSSIAVASRDQPVVRRRIVGSGSPVLRKSLLDQTMQSNTLVGRDVLITESSQERSLQVGISRTTAICSTTSKGTTGRRSRSAHGTRRDAIDDVRLVSSIDSSQAGHTLSVVGRQVSRDATNREVGRQLVHRDQGSHSTIRTRAEELRTQRSSHNDFFRDMNEGRRVKLLFMKKRSCLFCFLILEITPVPSHKKRVWIASSQRNKNGSSA